MTDIDKLVPAPTKVQAGGREFEIKPLTVRRMAGLARALKGVAIPADITEADVFALVGENADKVVEAVALATDEKVDVIGDLGADDFIVLAGAVVGAYSDFFVRRAVPALAAAAKNAMPAIGPLLSKGS